MKVRNPPRRVILFAVLSVSAVFIAGCDRDAPARDDGAAPQPSWFVEQAEQRGLRFNHQSAHRERYFLPEDMCGGAALFDMDNDGDLDAYLVQAGTPLDALEKETSSAPPNMLFRNRGDGTFEDVTAGSGADHRGYGMGVATGDYDNDGDLDLYVTNLGPNALLRNDGGGRFTDVSRAAGVDHPGWGTSAAFLDHDNDGDLDLFVCNYLVWSVETELDCSMHGGADYCSPRSYKSPACDVLYRNNGDGTFSDVTQQTGVSASLGTGLGVVCADFNRDGWTDIFVANDGMVNHLWLNSNGRFEDVAMLYGCASDLQGIAKAGMGVSAADIDFDGDLDILVGNMSSETDSLYRNELRYYRDSTAEIGLAAASKTFTRFGLAWMDFDNDGWLDLYEANGRVVRKAQRYADDPYAEPNLLFRGQSDGKLVEVKPRGGTNELLCHTSRGAAFGDIDNDGGVDVLVVNRDGPAYLLGNIAPRRGHWIMLRAVQEHGRDAIGAVITARIGEKLFVQEIRTAYSYCSANDPRVHIGLGKADTLNDVRVRWVGGEEESFGDLAADQIVTLKRGTGAVANRERE